MTSALNLSVYQLSYKCTSEVFKIVKKYPKDLKYSLGKQFFYAALDLPAKIITANRLKQKHTGIEEALLKVELMFLYSRLSLDFKVITLGEYKILSERLSEI